MSLSSVMTGDGDVIMLFLLQEAKTHKSMAVPLYTGASCPLLAVEKGHSSFSDSFSITNNYLRGVSHEIKPKI